MTTAGAVLSLLTEIDDLYASVTLKPDAWDDAGFAEWMEARSFNMERLDREAVKIVQRAVRRSQRLQRYWVEKGEGPADWRMRVDEALGSAGWRPGLDLAEWGMRADPDPELFDELGRRFRATNFRPLSVSYDEWLADSAGD